ncbi:MAG: hypothetical protein FD129_2555, partial [bacterium]
MTRSITRTAHRVSGVLFLLTTMALVPVSD